MYDLGGGITLQRVLDERCPWTSPGSAPIFGNGCGAAGGNPHGCLCNDFESQEAGAFGCYGDDDRLYGLESFKLAQKPTTTLRQKL